MRNYPPPMTKSISLLLKIVSIAESLARGKLSFVADANKSFHLKA